MAAPWLNGREKDWLGKPPAKPREPAPAPDGVIYYPLRCPKCKSTEVKTHTTKAPGPNRRRYHSCKTCGHNFHSIEADPA